MTQLIGVKVNGAPRDCTLCGQHVKSRLCLDPEHNSYFEQGHVPSCEDEFNQAAQHENCWLLEIIPKPRPIVSYDLYGYHDC